MKLSDRWEIVSGNGDYVLIEHREGKSPKTGEPTTTQHKTFHPSLNQCAAKITKESGLYAVECESIREVSEQLRGMKRTIEKRLCEEYDDE